MGKIFYLMGKSSSGKDTIYGRLKERFPKLRTVTLYTTRPIRKGEEEGREYHFTNEESLKRFQEAGKVIELREYHTIHGIWKYFTVDDGQFDLVNDNYLMIGTLESYEKMKEYFGEDALVPVYIEVEDGRRLLRAIEREQRQSEPKYAELCRRFLADTEDFSEEKLKGVGKDDRFINDNLEDCLRKISERIQSFVNHREEL